jgi:hypothetical protein
VDADELVVDPRPGPAPTAAAPPDPDRFDPALALRVCWIAVRLIAVFYLGQQGVLFFYQGF